MKSLMVIPYVSNNKLSRYFQYLIEGYTFQPDKIDYVPNKLDNKHYQNLLDYKVIESFLKNKPTDYVIYHASDVYLMPQDLAVMIEILRSNDKAFCIGLYPITDWKTTRMNEAPICPGRIGIWKADIFEKCMVKAFSGTNFHMDEIYRMAAHAMTYGYECLISKTARPQRIFINEFQTVAI